MPRARRQSTEPQVLDWAGDLPASFLLCRDMGHTWKPYTAEYLTGERQYRRVLRCARCHTERVQFLSITGHIEAGHYVYPDGYAMPKQSGGYTMAVRDLCHLTSVTRLIGDSERAAS